MVHHDKVWIYYNLLLGNAIEVILIPTTKCRAAHVILLSVVCAVVCYYTYMLLS